MNRRDSVRQLFTSYCLLFHHSLPTTEYMSAIARKFTPFIIFIALIVVIIFLGNRRDFGPQQYGQFILDGIRGGTIYALVALGLVVIHNVTGIVNFAQGAFVMLGAMITADVYSREWPIGDTPKMIVAILIAVVVTTIIGILFERLAIYPARNASPLTLIIITVGAYIVLQGLALIYWGSGAQRLPAFSTLFSENARDTIYRPLGIVIKEQSFWIWGTAAIAMGSLAWFFNRTILGKALRACAINPKAARLMGISPNRMSMLSFALAALIGAIAGVVLAPATSPIYDMGLRLGLKGFVAAIIGGFVSAPAAVIGGIFLGIIENLAAGVTNSGLKDIFAFIILILVLLYRPQGILNNSDVTEKV